jgi:hypothetical protein
MQPLGRRRWVIAEGYLPGRTRSASRELTSHETACILNTGDQPAQVRITIFYSDREPGGPYQLVVAARRTAHVRFDDLSEPEPIPRATDFSSVIESDLPIVVQHTRLDNRSGALALMTTTAWTDPEPEP